MFGTESEKDMTRIAELTSALEEKQAFIKDGLEKGVKIDIQKYKRRKGYHKKIGHRQRYLRVKITGINA